MSLAPVPADDLLHILDQAGPLWSELRGCHLFITGGTGFFGRWILESLAAANRELGLGVRADILTRDPARFRSLCPWLSEIREFSFISGDVRAFEFPRERYSHVIHAATEASAALIAENPTLMVDTIVDGTRRALELAVACGARGFLLTSSGAVYGPQPPAMTHVSEEYGGGPDPCDAMSCYGEGKRLAELYCAIYAERFGLQAKVARCFAFVGPYLPQDTHFAVGNFIRDAAASREIVVKGDGTPYRSYLYAADLVVWLLAVLLRGQVCRPYNVGSENGLTIAELAAITAETAGVAGCRVLGTPVPGRPAPRYVPCTRRAREELGLKETIDLREAIRRTLDWTRANS